MSPDQPTITGDPGEVRKPRKPRRIIPQEHRDKTSATMKGRTFSAEHRAALSRAGLGRKLTDAEKAKISVAKRGKPRAVSRQVLEATEVWLREWDAANRE